MYASSGSRGSCLWTRIYRGSSLFHLSYHNFLDGSSGISESDRLAGFFGLPHVRAFVGVEKERGAHVRPLRKINYIRRDTPACTVRIYRVSTHKIGSTQGPSLQNFNSCFLEFDYCCFCLKYFRCSAACRLRSDNVFRRIKSKPESSEE